MMWFNVLKLDLANLSQDLKPLDVENSPVEINAPNKCAKKLKDYAQKLIDMKSRHSGIEVIRQYKDNIPEFLACKLVEEIDKFFGQLEYPERNNEGYWNIKPYSKKVDFEYENKPATTICEHVSYGRTMNFSFYLFYDKKTIYSLEFVSNSGIIMVAARQYWREL